MVDWVASGAGPHDIEVRRGGTGRPLMSHANGLSYELSTSFTSVEAKLAEMDAVGIDMTIVSLAPELFAYDLPPARALEAARLANDALADFARRSGGRVHAVATLPMGTPAAAAAELERAHLDLRLPGALLGASVEGEHLDAARFEPVLRTAEELGAPLMLHPYRSMTGRPGLGMDGFHLANTLGNPLETSIAASRLILGGVLDRHPGLTFQLAHGGGALPYLLGRLEHAYETNPAARAVAAANPASYLGRFLFDTVLFDPRAVDFLLSLAGPGNVVFGSDLPFAEADRRSLERLTTAGADNSRVLGLNAVRAYRLDAGDEAGEPSAAPATQG